MSARNENAVPVNRRLAAVNSLSSMATHILNVAVLFWINQHLVKRVPEGEFALIPLVNGLMLFPPLITMVLTSGIGRFVLKAVNAGDRDRVVEIVSSMTPFLVAAAGLFGAAGMLLVWKIDVFINVDPEFLDDCRLMLSLLLAIAAVRVSSAAFCVGFFVKQRVVLQNLINVGTEVVRLSILLALILFVESRVAFIIIASVSAGALGHIARVVLSRRILPDLRFDRRKFRLGVVPEIMNFGSWVVVRSTATQLRLGLTPAILLNWAGAAELSCYFLGTTVLRQLGRFAEQALRPLAAPLMAMFERGETDRMRSAYFNAGRYSLWLGMAAATPFIIFNREFFELYIGGSALDPSRVGLILALSLLLVPLQFGNRLVGPLSNASGQIRTHALYTVGLQGSILIGLIVAIRYLDKGAVAAAWIPLLIQAVFSPLIMWRLAHRLAETTLGFWCRETLWPGLAPALAGGVFWVAAKFIIAPQTWLGLGLAAVPGGIVYLACLWTYGFRVRERRDLLRAFERLMEKIASSRMKARAQRIRKTPSVPNSRRIEALIHARTPSQREALRLPGFFVIGAPYAGPEWLDERLRAHPDAFLPERRNINYFQREMHRPLHGYSAHFEGANENAKRGEVAADYAAMSPSRIRHLDRVCPGAKFVLMLRDPAERDWLDARGLVDDAADADVTNPGVIRRGDYAAMLDEWESVVGTDRLLVVFHEDIYNRPVELLGEVFDHLGLRRDVDIERICGTLPAPDVVPEAVRAALADRCRERAGALADRLGDRVGRWTS